MSTPVSPLRSRVPRFAEAAVQRARLTVVPRTARKAPRVPFVTLVSLLLIGGVAGLLLFNTHMQQASFFASSLEERAAVLAGQEESLRMQLHRLRDPQHVAAEARRLGMVPAANPAFIRLSDGVVLGDPAPADAADAVRINPLPPAKPRSLRPRMVIADPPGTRGERRGGAETEDRDTAARAGSRVPALDGRTTDRNDDRPATGRAR